MIVKLFRIVSVLIFTYVSAFAWSADTTEHKTTGGIDVFYRVIFEYLHGTLASTNRRGT